MSVSRLFIFLLFMGIVCIFIGGIFGIQGYIIFLAYNLFLILLLIFDYIITPNRKSFVVTRECDRKFSLGVQNHISINIKNESQYNIKFKIFDEVPEHMESINKNMEVAVLAETQGKVVYYVVPDKRGEYNFGYVHLKYGGILKLCNKYCKFDLNDSYKVYPNMRDLAIYLES